MNVSALPKLYDEAFAIEYLGVSKPTLNRLRRRHKLGFIKVGGKIKYTERHLLDYLESEECLASKSPTNTASSSEAAPRTGISSGKRADKNGAALRALTILGPQS